MQQLEFYSEPMETIPSNHVRPLLKKSDNKWQLLINRLAPHNPREVVVPAGSHGFSDGRLFHWKVQDTINAWNFFQGQIQLLTRQLCSGLKNVTSEVQENAATITRLYAGILDKSSDARQMLSQSVSDTLLSLMEKLAHLTNPPTNLLSNCVSTMSTIAKDNPRVWNRITEVAPSLFPYFARNPLSKADEGQDINPGLVGSLLAQQECVNGEYPLTSAFLDLILHCIKSQPRDGDSHPTTPSILYVIGHMLPSFRQWRFSKTVEKELFGQKILGLCDTIISESDSSELRSLVCKGLLAPATCSTLVSLIMTGDRVIQSLLEAQGSWESGVGTELCSVVNLAMIVFRKVIAQADPKHFEGGPNSLLCGTGNPNNFLLTVSHYIYHLQSRQLPISAMDLLGTVASIWRMSLLASLGSDAEAIKDILILRLESRTEDLKLKITILRFFTACISSQPGFIQLLSGVRPAVEVVSEGAAAGKEMSAEEEKKKNEETELVYEGGCLTSILQLLKESKGLQDREHGEEMHLALSSFILELWLYQRIVAVAFLKRNEDFWDNLTWPLFEKEKRKQKLRTISTIFRILSSEIYTFKGQVEKKLKALLEKFTNEKETFFSGWSEFVLEQVDFASVMDETISPSVDRSEKNDSVALLSSWKAFLIILSKDQPVPISPIQCQMIISSLIGSIKRHMSSEVEDFGTTEVVGRVITSLSEVCLILMRRWQTKCAENWAEFCQDLCLMLELLGSTFDSLLPRSRASVLAIANTALRTSSFKLDKEDRILATWLEPTASIVLKSFFHYENLSASSGSDSRIGVQPPILAIGLLRNLLQRLDDPSIWYPVIHRNVMVQALLSRLHNSLKKQGDTDLIHSIFGLLISIAKTEPGCTAIIASGPSQVSTNVQISSLTYATFNIFQLLWLPLSDVKQATKEWISVFQLGLQLATTLLKVGGHQAVDQCVDVAALLHEQLKIFLLAPKISIDLAHLEVMVTAASFIGTFFAYYKQWQIKHSESLVQAYQNMCSLMHVSVCLLVRPSMLGMLINKQKNNTTTQVQYIGHSAHITIIAILLQGLRRRAPEGPPHLLDRLRDGIWCLVPIRAGGSPELPARCN